MKKNTRLVKSMALAAALTMTVAPVTAFAANEDAPGQLKKQEQDANTGEQPGGNEEQPGGNEEQPGGNEEQPDADADADADSDNDNDRDRDRDRDNDREEEILEEEVPLIDIPEIEVVDEPIIEEVEIGDGEVILSDIPKTGDPSMVWLAMSGISGPALAIRRRK